MEWLESEYLYLGLMLFSMAYPIAQSFERRLRYYQNWKGLFLGILAMMLIFIPWDIYFTAKGVWWFNDRYITGFKIWHLPIEEWAFFVVVPFACVFLYEVLKHFVKADVLKPIAQPTFLILAAVLLVVGALNFTRNYTAITFIITSISLVILGLKKPKWIGRFFLTYVICWLPFLLINGALTGNFTSEAVVNYDPEHNLGLRVLTIPIEDSVYNLLMLLIVISIYENQRKHSV